MPWVSEADYERLQEFTKYAHKLSLIVDKLGGEDYEDAAYYLQAMRDLEADLDEHYMDYGCNYLERTYDGREPSPIAYIPHELPAPWGKGSEFRGRARQHQRRMIF